VAPDDDAAARLVRGNVGIFARFVGQAAVAGGAPDGKDLRTEQAVAAAYDGEHHGLASAPQTTFISSDFVKDFAVVGSAEHCVERLQDLIGLGLDHVIVVGPSRDVDRDGALALTRGFAAEVLPVLRSDGLTQGVRRARSGPDPGGSCEGGSQGRVCPVP
jgi:5,10-methylenetetrahydromethanopterin reductase